MAKFITLEGGDGVGKTTQIQRLCDAFFAANIDYVRTREPGGTDGANLIRKLLVEQNDADWSGETEVLLHYAARRDHVEKLIKPALADGRWVICDRFADSTEAYQGAGHVVDADYVAQVRQAVIGDFTPDITILLDIEPEDALARAGLRGDDEDRYEALGVGFQQRLRAGFLEIAERDSARVVVINAAGTPEDVAVQIASVVNQRFGIGLAITS